MSLSSLPEGFDVTGLPPSSPNKDAKPSAKPTPEQLNPVAQQTAKGSQGVAGPILTGVPPAQSAPVIPNVTVSPTGKSSDTAASTIPLPQKPLKKMTNEELLNKLNDDLKTLRKGDPSKFASTFDELCSRPDREKFPFIKMKGWMGEINKALAKVLHERRALADTIFNPNTELNRKISDLESSIDLQKQSQENASKRTGVTLKRFERDVKGHIKSSSNQLSPLIEERNKLEAQFREFHATKQQPLESIRDKVKGVYLNDYMAFELFRKTIQQLLG